MNIDGNTKKIGLIGHPVEHTFSPVMHNAAFKKLDMNYIYLAFDIEPEKLSTSLGAMVALGFEGLNVTVPHKETIIPYLHGLAKEAILIGAVNTVHIVNGKCIGHNTDAYGFGNAVRRAFSSELKGKSVVVIGAGGGARAVVARCAIEEASNIVVADIVHKKAEKLSEEIIKYLPDTKIHVVDINDDAFGKIVKHSDFVINATPIGLKESDPLPVDPSFLREGQMVFDLIYNPVKTKFMVKAEKCGCMVSNGLMMLLYQGMKSFEIWTGIVPPENVMRDALIAKISASDKE